jgi:hypothetical protein
MDVLYNLKNDKLTLTVPSFEITGRFITIKKIETKTSFFSKNAYHITTKKSVRYYFFGILFWVKIISKPGKLTTTFYPSPSPQDSAE